MVIDWLTWFLARVICSLAIKNHIYAHTRSFGSARRADRKICSLLPQKGSWGELGFGIAAYLAR